MTPETCPKCSGPIVLVGPGVRACPKCEPNPEAPFLNAGLYAERRGLIARVLKMEEHEPVGIDEDEGFADEEEPGRFLLVEHGTGSYSERRWVTTHDTAQAAADYSRDQEYAEDWAVGLLLDLDTCERVEWEWTWTETSRRAFEVPPIAPPEPE